MEMCLHRFGCAGWREGAVAGSNGKLEGVGGCGEVPDGEWVQGGGVTMGGKVV